MAEMNVFSSKSVHLALHTIHNLVLFSLTNYKNHELIYKIYHIRASIGASVYPSESQIRLTWCSVFTDQQICLPGQDSS